MTDESPATAMKRRLRDDLKAAMQARRLGEVRLLRGLIAALDNAEAVPLAAGHERYVLLDFGDGSAEDPRRALGAAEVEGLLRSEQAERQAAAAELGALGRTEAAQTLIEEAAVVGRYLVGGSPGG